MISRGSRTGTRVGLIGWFGNRVWRVIEHDLLPEPVFHAATTYHSAGITCSFQVLVIRLSKSSGIWAHSTTPLGAFGSSGPDVLLTFMVRRLESPTSDR